MHRQPKRNRAQRGSTILELGLIYAAFLFIVIGIIDVGQAMFIHETYATRVRSAARYGAVRQWNPTTKIQIENMVLFGQPTGTGESGWLGLSRDKITVTQVAGSPANLSVELSGYQVQLFSPYIAGRKTGTPIRMTVPMETP